MGPAQGSYAALSACSGLPSQRHCSLQRLCQRYACLTAVCDEYNLTHAPHAALHSSVAHDSICFPLQRLHLCIVNCTLRNSNNAFRAG